MKNKKGFKLLAVLFISLFTVSISTGCSCTSSMCSEADEASIKSQIRENNIQEWTNSAVLAGMTVGSQDFESFINDKVNEEYEKHPKACLVITDDVDPSTGASIEKKTWGDAWKTGLLEGLIVYPIAWLLSGLTNLFGGNGGAQLLAIFITVIIIRSFMLLVNFRGQLSTIKMQSIQGEVSKLSERMRDPNLTQQEKQALSMKMMDIYKKNDIHPFSSMISQFISFPIFIAVWAAMNQTLAIRKGTLFGLEFGNAINSQIFEGNIAAIVLFLLMIAGQVVTMKLSTWLKIRKEKKKNPHYTKPAKSDSEKQMNIMMTVMIVMVVMSGFLLPAALVIYWFLGSLFSIGQILVFSTDFVTNKLNSLANRKKKAKVIR